MKDMFFFIQQLDNALKRAIEVTYFGTCHLKLTSKVIAFSLVGVVHLAHRRNWRSLSQPFLAPAGVFIYFYSCLMFVCFSIVFVGEVCRGVCF